MYYICNMDGYYINKNDIKIIIPADTKKLNLSFKNLVEIVCNSELEELVCHNNQLNKLILNDKLSYLKCDINTKLENINSNTKIYLYE